MVQPRALNYSHLKQIKKFKKLLKKQRMEDNHELSSVGVSVLKKRPRFAITPKSIPLDSIISCIEDGINSLVDEDKEIIRQSCASILRKVKPSKSKVIKRELDVLKNIRSDSNIPLLR